VFTVHAAGVELGGEGLVGALVGAYIGACVGADIGACVGAVDGAGVGAAVGASVSGSLSGSGMGMGEGDTVPCWVVSPVPPEPAATICTSAQFLNCSPHKTLAP